ncbi:hypothetical protein DFJ63DRAFT_312574 [Scheffersomyces coipomensis]|uniref:uncharacterized protein n=1 Tax=Scheffersomyces coipomensis TaxID=1788519 RepID=UPI00315CCE7A
MSASNGGKGRPRRKRNGASKVEKIDLSASNDKTTVKDSGDSSPFEVKGYTHEPPPDQEESQFENDLDYLLNSNPDTIITQAVVSTEISKSIEIGQDDENGKPSDSKPKSRKPKTAKVSLADVTKDMDEIQFSSDSDEEEPVPVKEKRKKKKSPKPKPQTKPIVESDESEIKLIDNEEPIDFSEFVNEQSEAKDSRRKERNKKRSERRQKAKKLSKEANEESTPVQSSTASPTTTPEPTLDKPFQPDSPSFPFDVKLRQTPKAASNGRLSENLPQIQPKRTIIGVSFKQLLKSNTSDVKIKTIASSPAISKYAATALKFCIKHSDDVFGYEDIDAKDIFIKLCINVALFESVGFKKTAQQYPNVLQLFGDYEEINLDTTRTKLTPSNRDIHQNNLDYSVLSYIGNIIIWANHIQHENDVRLSIKHRDDISKSIIKQNFGGYHLWDKLIRESKGMNAKRWKHIVKFRQNFPLEEQQFILILRFMNVLEPAT